MHAAPGALQGVRVVDLTSVIMGPLATVTLADLGADVVKVEPLHGDMNRRAGTGRHPDMSPLSLNLQRNKRSLALDLGAPEGRAVLDDLVRTADVLVTNLRPRSRERLGVTYDRLADLNPGLVLCTAQAYGQHTERRDDPAYDDIVQAASGAARLAEPVDGVPRFAPYVVADKVTGLYIVVAIMAALLERQRSGLGQAVDVPMVDAMIAFNLVEHLGGHTFEPVVEPFGWARVRTPERAPTRTADGWICIMPYSTRNWDDFFRVAGRDDLVGDPRFRELTDRYRLMGELLGVVRAATPARTTADWLQICTRLGIPAADVFDLAQAHTDPYVTGRGLLTERTHPTEGVYRTTRTPLDLSRTPVRFDRHAPHIGADTREVLTELGYSSEQVDELARQAVIGTGPGAGVEAIR